MFLVQRLAEEKILAAIERGEMDDLPGKGRPLVLDDTSAVPEDLRAGYRLLKNAGYLPPELELRREIQDVEALLLHVDSGDEAQRLSRRLRALKFRLAMQGHGGNLLVAEGRYREKLLHRIGDNPDSDPGEL